MHNYTTQNFRKNNIESQNNLYQNTNQDLQQQNQQRAATSEPKYMRATTNNWLRGGNDTIGKQFSEIKKSRKELEQEALNLVHRLALMKQQEQKTKKIIKQTLRETGKFQTIKQFKQSKIIQQQELELLKYEEQQRKKANIQIQQEITRKRKQKSMDILKQRNTGAAKTVLQIKQKNFETLEQKKQNELQQKILQATYIKNNTGQSSSQYKTYQANILSKRQMTKEFQIRQEKEKKMKINQDVLVMDTLEQKFKSELEKQKQIQKQVEENLKSLKNWNYHDINNNIKNHNSSSMSKQSLNPLTNRTKNSIDRGQQSSMSARQNQNIQKVYEQNKTKVKNTYSNPKNLGLQQSNIQYPYIGKTSHRQVRSQTNN